MGTKIRETPNKVEKPKIDDRGQMTKLSFIVDSGACDNVLDPRDPPGCPFIGINESKQGDIFFAAFGDPIPPLGENKLSFIHMVEC